MRPPLFSTRVEPVGTAAVTRSRKGEAIRQAFRKAAQAISEATGTPWAFLIALVIILVWVVTGPIFDFSDTWQLVINTGTTIVTFLMVFLIQNTQNREAKAIQLKLDELIRGVEGARTRLVDLQNLTDEELDQLQTEFEHIRERAGGGASRMEAQQELGVANPGDQARGEEPAGNSEARNSQPLPVSRSISSFGWRA